MRPTLLGTFELGLPELGLDLGWGEGIDRVGEVGDPLT